MVPYITGNTTIVIFDSKGRPIWYEKAENESKIILLIAINDKYHNIFKTLENNEIQVSFKRSELPSELFNLIESGDILDFEIVDEKEPTINKQEKKQSNEKDYEKQKKLEQEKQKKEQEKQKERTRKTKERTRKTKERDRKGTRGRKGT